MSAKKAADRRAPDADGAIEVAFVEGVLPEEDRRADGALIPEGGSEARVVEPEALSASHEAHPDINESHPCPPFTDCGGG